MKKITALLFLLTSIAFSQNDSITISGKVTDGQNPLKNVKITLNDLTKSHFTNAQGYYSLKAEVGDLVHYSYAGMKNVEILVEDVTRIVNMTMFPDIEQLPEVVVTKSRRKSQAELEIDYQFDPNLIRTANGILNPETSSYQIRMLPEDQIGEVGLCILGILRGQFPGVSVSGNCINGGSVSVRGSSSLYNDSGAIFDVDGQVLKDVPLWLPVANMKRIAVLPGFAARNLYGSIASGGVVIINTHTGTAFATSKEIKDKSRLRNNKYMGDAVSAKSLRGDSPTYLQELRASTSFDEAKKIYQFYAPRYSASYSYYVDAFQYFMKTWNNSDFEDGIIADGLTRFDDNPIALKAFAYLYQTKGNFERANELFKEAFILRPNYAQSYMDIANSYREIGSSKKAAAIFARYGYLKEVGFLYNDSTSFTKIMDRELNNLIAIKGRDILSKREFEKAVFEEDFKGTRLVFEWNDSEAEFELQFVNPEGRYFKTRHSLAANIHRIREEKLVGYSCEEFLIDESLAGTWQINAMYLGNKRLTPTYLKVSIYYNYGSPSQRKEIKMFRLGLKNVNRQLFKISNKVAALSK